jgi:hypothetical protein
METKTQGVYKVSGMKGMIGKGAIAPLHQTHIQDDIENLTPVELAASYGFERHQRVTFCPLI